MTKYERATGLFLIALGVAVMYYAMTALSLGTMQEPGPGFFPVVCGIGIVILCVIWFAGNRKPVTQSEPFWEAGQWVAPAISTLIITVYTALMEPLGYMLSTFIFLVAWQFAIEREKWLKTGAIAVIGTVAMYAIFSYLLRVPLPEGLLI
ncbi:hypothetical protein AXX12_16910 [Anaerosporomusa subterranea]|jgi:hypothetical protein|uniref:DUF1468 domain-containing protein n=1 Tax=Anaerosporomusa subterranea TaxID=1794912 RepID=A0A154BV88_ANASB|nr:tripartite tricarboxylate transporter TctB family protein [Anaerosporomusa subterranea]KYZ77944.1 hypothetical protein AXX12_16910 [Anaerosporomusa subterranea]MDF2501950.1 hypothetical protein [Anaerosporomusa subterranea]